MILGKSWKILILNFIEIAWYFQIQESVVRSKFVQFFFVLFIFFGITVEIVWIINIFIDFRIHRNTLMKFLYLIDYKWLLPQNQRVRVDFLGYKQYEALATHIKPFLKKTLK